MAKKDAPEPTVTEVNPTMEIPGPNDASASSSDKNVPRWPSQPQPLRRSAASKVLNALFDCALILAALLLIMKAGLCVLAHKRDKSTSGTIANPASDVTDYLMRFNGQVSRFCAEFVK